MSSNCNLLTIDPNFQGESLLVIFMGWNGAPIKAPFKKLGLPVVISPRGGVISTHLDVSENSGTSKWMVYKSWFKPYEQIDDLGGGKLSPYFWISSHENNL